MDEISASFLNKRLHLTVMPTEKCNYRCTYCYEDFQNGKMSSRVVDSLIRLIEIRAPILKYLKISWFGGEPLLAISEIERVMIAAQKCSEEYNIDLSASTTTNGYLLDCSMFRLLCDLSVRHHQITIDGPSYIHNRRRRLVNNTGNIDVILRNIRNMCMSDERFSITLRIHLDEISFKAFDDLLMEMGSIVFDSRVMLHFEPLRNMGRALPPDIQVMSRERFAEAKKQISSRLLELGIIPPDVELLVTDHVCYAAMPNSFLIRSTGDIQMCTVALSENFNSVGQLNENGSITLNKSYMQWLDGWHSSDRNLLHCPAKSIIARLNPVNEGCQ